MQRHYRAYFVCIFAVSREEARQQEMSSLRLREELMLLNESLHSTSVQNDALQRDKNQLGLSLRRLTFEPVFVP